MENKVHDAFDAIHASEQLKRRAKAQIRTATFDYGRDTFRRNQARYRLSGLLAALVLCITGTGLWYLPVTRIGLDINPSLEIRVNLLDRVIALEGLNTDGKALAQAMAVDGMPCADAIQRIMISEELEPYLENGSLISITVAGPDGQHRGEILSDVICRAYAVADDDQIFYSQTNAATARKAREAGLTVTRYQAWQALREHDPDLTPAEIQEMTMEQIRELLGFQKMENPCGE